MQPQNYPQAQTAPDTQASIQEDADDLICLRSAKASGLLTIFTTLLLLAANQNAYAWGFLIGALLSLLSLISLTVIVPMLFRPDAPRYMSALLVMTLFMKLPLFMIGLYLMTHLRGVAPAAGVLGIGLAPIVIGLKTAGAVLTQGLRAARPALADLPAEEPACVSVPTPHPTRTRIAELASDRI